MSQEIEAIKSKLNIVDLVGEYVRLQKAGNNWKACCPFHNEKTPSFSVSEDKQFFHCFGCGKGGDIFGFLMEIEGLDFRDALENLAQRAGVELPKYGKESISNTKEKSKIWEILELATVFYEKQLWEGLGRDEILSYLKKRGLTEETIRVFRLGYAPAGWRNLVSFLVGRGFEIKDILAAGLIIPKDNNSAQVDNYYDRFRDRIMFPIADSSSKILGYSARINPKGDESQAKYINTPETEIYHKSNVLYGIDKAKMNIKEKDWVLLVEGQMDVIASHQAGIKNTVAVSGTALTVEQLSLIKRYTKNLKMFFDMDEAGQKAAFRSAQLAFEKELNVSIVAIEDGKDAADAVKDNAEVFLTAVLEASSAMEYFVQKSLKNRNPSAIADKKKIIEELSGLINSFSNNVEKEHWIKELAERLNISEQVLFAEFNKNEIFHLNNTEERLNYPKKENIEFDKIKEIQIQIMGIFISDSHIWKEGIVKYKEAIEENFTNKNIAEIILTKGPVVNFNLDKLLAGLENQEQQRFLRELYFKNCEKSDSFSSTKDKWLAVEQFFFELKRQLSKEKSSKLIEQIKIAEKNGKKEELTSLTEELMRINKI
ncbi:MAG: DNA primase [Candidatus Moraniibacteriota bacterium]